MDCSGANGAVEAPGRPLRPAGAAGPAGDTPGCGWGTARTRPAVGAERWRLHRPGAGRAGRSSRPGSDGGAPGVNARRDGPPQSTSWSVDVASDEEQVDCQEGHHPWSGAEGPKGRAECQIDEAQEKESEHHAATKSAVTTPLSQDDRLLSAQHAARDSPALPVPRGGGRGLPLLVPPGAAPPGRWRCPVPGRSPGGCSATAPGDAGPSGPIGRGASAPRFVTVTGRRGAPQSPLARYRGATPQARAAGVCPGCPGRDGPVLSWRQATMPWSNTIDHENYEGFDTATTRKYNRHVAI